METMTGRSKSKDTMWGELQAREGLQPFRLSSKWFLDISFPSNPALLQKRLVSDADQLFSLPLDLENEIRKLLIVGSCHLRGLPTNWMPAISRKLPLPTDATFTVELSNRTLSGAF
jgi:hypothetical protein